MEDYIDISGCNSAEYNGIYSIRCVFSICNFICKYYKND